MITSSERGSFSKSSSDPLSCRLAAADVLRPPVVPDHRLVECVGRGSYGQVWLAVNALGSSRAVKIVFRADFHDPEPYEREFRGIKKFEPISRTHPGLVQILQVGRNDEAGYFYYVMELADNAASAAPEAAKGPEESSGQALYEAKTLSQELRRHRRLPVEKCVKIGLALASALDHLHKNGLVHRDVKPSNIIFVNGVPKLADIGLVTDVTNAKSLVGTVGYIPPEGPGTPQADLYSLGKVLYEISSGKPRTHFPEPPTELGRFPDQGMLLELNSVIHKACEVNPSRRYSSAEELLVDLRWLVAGKSLRRRNTQKRLVARVLKVSAILPILAALYFFQGPAATSLAVIPFVEEDPPNDGGYLSSSLADEIRDALTRVDALKVAARSSSVAFQNTSMKPKEITRALGVRHLLQGRIERSDNRLKISVELLDARDGGYLLWSNVYDRPATNLVGIKEHVAKHVTSELRVNVTEVELQSMTRGNPENSEAYVCYLQGRYYWNKRNATAMARAVECFRQAIAKDSQYALAYAGLADSSVLGGSLERRDEALEAARTAVRLDRNLADGHAALGKILMARADWHAAMREFKEALRLNPKYPTGLQWYGTFLGRMGRVREGLPFIRRAVKLEPNSVIIKSALGSMAWFARDYDAAARHYRRTIEMDPTIPSIHFYLGSVLVEKGRHKEAVDSFLQAAELFNLPPEIIKEQRDAFKSEGIEGFWKKSLDQKLSGRLRASAYDIALNYARLGNRDQTLTWLEKSLESAKGEMIITPVRAELDFVREDPRFAEIMRRLNLPLQEDASL